VVLWWRFHQTPPMGHGRMGIGESHVVLTSCPFLDTLWKEVISYVFIKRTLVLLSWWNLLSKKDSMN
jgi:hypothetical protein